MERKQVQEGAKPQPRFVTSRQAHEESRLLHEAYRSLCDALLLEGGVSFEARATVLALQAALKAKEQSDG